MSTRRIAVAGLAVLSIAALALPAQANGHTDGTTTTFSLTAGTMSIDAPATAALGTFAAGTVTSVAGPLGVTTVTDNRGGLLSAQIITLTAGDFTTGAGGVNETILGATVTAKSGPVAHTNTTATAVKVETTGAEVLSGTTIASFSAYNGNDVATYNPSITIPVPVTNSAGTYTGVITQTVTSV